MSEKKMLHGLVQRNDFQRAHALANKLLNDSPDDPELLYLTGHVLRAIGHMGVALPVLAKALAKVKTQPNLWMTYGATLHDLNRWEEAEKAFTVVHTMAADDPMPPANIAATYVQRGLWRDAANWCDKALTLDPHNHIARISKGFAMLSLGRWKEAWTYHEALYGEHLNVRLYCDPPEPEWDGTKGKTVVVQCDQGVGDIIMFSQCIPQMQADCREVIVECAPRLVRYFQRNFPGCYVYGTLKQKSVEWVGDHKIDAHIHISALGKFYRNRDTDFPRQAYITPDPGRLAKWQFWLDKFPKPWVGVSWKGGIQATQTHLRSVKLSDLAPVMELGGSFIDLSYEDKSAEIAAWNIDHKAQVIRPPVDVSDYEDTIALVAALDEVVTVTTTVAHVCGALGRSAHVLVPEVAQWRYAYRYGDGTRLIWYSDALRMYRQVAGEPGWAHAVNRVARALRQDMRKAA